MQPFKIIVSWYGDEAEVELSILRKDWSDSDDYLLRTFPEPVEAVAWAVKWFNDRGLHYHHFASEHERLNHKHVTLHAIGRLSERICCKDSDAGVE